MSLEHTASIRAARRPRPGPRERLRAALAALCQNHGTIEHHRESSWASITFTGTRHTLCIRFAGTDAVDAGEAFIAALPDHEFVIIGQLVADATITNVDHSLLPQPQMSVECELLLLDDV